jgi:hypothetical protein
MSPEYLVTPVCDVKGFVRDARWFKGKKPRRNQRLLLLVQMLGMVLLIVPLQMAASKY